MAWISAGLIKLLLKRYERDDFAGYVVQTAGATGDDASVADPEGDIIQTAFATRDVLEGPRLRLVSKSDPVSSTLENGSTAGRAILRLAPNATAVR
ncbi:hypothetical protein QYH69_19990 [Paraburkholderia sp. SARCC-3016]|uniref:hypothetical protein n=1 Tax=Paraburkholderia sp. SARCC-3016 TaxID=3058611 RepID=UPI002808BB9E|nr:hypothetical protein [Paraburkholderia sp. SARCC-3016]MDQ7979534.1 hypothetical protein [Paraburkholderia sp. SARCC-3016]